MSKPKSKGLGRGLDALLGLDEAGAASAEQAQRGPARMLQIDRLQAGRFQPRTRMDESALQDLTASIRQHGLMQPIVVRPLSLVGTLRASAASHGDPLQDVIPRARPAVGSDERFEIIAGERRFRAAQAAGLKELPVIVREVDDQQALALALIENIQREDLNPLEQAQAVKRLIDEFSYSHEQAAEAIGRSRSATSNMLRLLNLAEPVQTMLLAGDLDMGHARALLALDRASQIMLGHQVVQRRLSVRETEKLVARELAGTPEAGKSRTRRVGEAPDRDIARLQEQLSDLLGTSVQVRQSARGRGQLLIDFTGPDQFEGLLQRMGLSLLRD